MSKLVNLTVRVDADQKRKVDIACAYLGTTISDIVRHGIRQTIDQYHKTYAVDTAQQRMVMESESTLKAYRLIEQFMAINGDVLRIDESGNLQLNGTFIPHEK